MSAENVGVLVYHFGLEPQTEFHSGFVHIIYKRFKAAFKLFLVDPPVAKSFAIVASFAEPAVVKYEHIYAGTFDFIDNSFKLGYVEIEIGCLPIVDDYRANAVDVAFVYQILPVQIMESAAHLSQPAVRIYKNGFRGTESFALFEFP